MSNFEPIVDEDRTQVARAHDQASLPRLWELFPRVKVHAPATHKRISGYRLPKLDDALIKKSLRAWRRGQTRPAPRAVGEDTVTIAALEGFSTDPWGNASDIPFETRFESLKNFGPIHLDMCHRMMDLRVASILSNTSAFSTETWSATNQLDDYESTSVPSRDINKHMRPFRILVDQMDNLEWMCVMDAEVMRVLTGYEEYSGRGTASLKPDFMGEGAAAQYTDFKAAFSESHGIPVQNIHAYRGIYDSAKEGQTSSRAKIHSGVLWIGLVDKRKSFDLTSSSTSEGPDGGIAIAYADLPSLDTWGPHGGDKMEWGAADCDFKVITPRYTGSALEMGVFYPSTENFSA